MHEIQYAVLVLSQWANTTVTMHRLGSDAVEACNDSWEESVLKHDEMQIIAP